MFEDEDGGLETGIVFVSTYARYSSKCHIQEATQYVKTYGSASVELKAGMLA